MGCTMPSCCDKRYGCLHFCFVLLLLLTIGGGVLLIGEGVVYNVQISFGEIMVTCTITRIFAKKVPKGDTSHCGSMPYTGCLSLTYSKIYQSNQTLSVTQCQWCGMSAEMATAELRRMYWVGERKKCWYDKDKVSTVTVGKSGIGSTYIMLAVGAVFLIISSFLIVAWVKCYQWVGERSAEDDLESGTEVERLLGAIQ